MKKIARYLSFLLLCLALFSLTGCANIEKPDIEEVITGKLDLLKNLDTATTQKYISYKELFPDAAKTSSIPTEVEEVFSLFFKDFDYKILSLDVEEETATANIRLQTIDAQTLAKDFAAARLKQYITAAADSQNTNENANDSLEAHYLLLNKILKNKDYPTVENTCTMHLINNNDAWYIKSDLTLENELVGGFISYLADTSLLSAKDAADIYFDTIKNMDEDQFSNYLGLNEALDTEDPAKKDLAEALLAQVHDHFDYQIQNAKDDGFTANVDVELTTLDAKKVLANYETKLDAYLATPEAVIDGADGRTDKSQELLLEEVQNSTDTMTVNAQVQLVNDGVTWKLQLDPAIGSALFGNLTNVPAPSDPDTKDVGSTDEASTDEDSSRDSNDSESVASSEEDSGDFSPEDEGSEDENTDNWDNE
ncbi:MAG: hypothetical protein ACOYBE_09525 [Blautia sp.]|jgi:hypothetical protein